MSMKFINSLMVFAAIIMGSAALTTIPLPNPVGVVNTQDKEEVKKLDLKQKATDKNRGKGYVSLTPEKRKYYQAVSHAKNGDRIQVAAKNLALPANFDVRTKNPLPIWDQGQCGSCYLVSTVRTMTDAGLMVGLGKPDGSFMIAVQYGMDRPRNFGGCDGGNGTEVIDWACKNGWIAERYVDISGTSYNDYPAYQASSGTDRTKPGAKVWVKGWTWGYVNAGGNPTTDEIKAALYLHGRLNVSLDAGGQFGGGNVTITSLGTSIDHEISMVAWDDSKDGGCFLLENQWGGSWGINGCQWVTYKAAKNLVDVFYVVATGIPIPPTVTVPNVVGSKLTDATITIKQAGLVVGILTGDSTQLVSSQLPPSGSSAPSGSSVALAFGTKPPPIGGVPPFTLWEGTAPKYIQVGDTGGYATLTDAEKAGQAIANTDKVSVLVYDSAKVPQLMETLTPKSPVPTGGISSITVTFVDGTIQEFTAISAETTLGELLERMKKSKTLKLKE